MNVYKRRALELISTERAKGYICCFKAATKSIKLGDSCHARLQIHVGDAALPAGREALVDPSPDFKVLACLHNAEEHPRLMIYMRFVEASTHSS
jgi:hypothetical protein